MKDNILTHLDKQNNPVMVDVHAKVPTYRTATAHSIIELPAEVMAKFENGELNSSKGAVFQTAIVGGIMAAKRTGELIPLCHPIGMDNCKITIAFSSANQVEITCTTSITAKTGIEMEALVGASMAALTIYDMCKALSHEIIIKETKLLSKTGGKQDFFRNER